MTEAWECFEKLEEETMIENTRVWVEWGRSKGRIEIINSLGNEVIIVRPGNKADNE